MTNGTRHAPGARANADDLKAEYELQRRSEKAGAFVLAARRALQSGNREEAKAQLKHAFAANPGDAASIDVLGDIYLEEGETQKALELFEKAFERYPKHVSFEEKAAICRLDLAEMEADKTMPKLLLESGDRDKIFERSSQKAVALSLCLPGAGQFYNDENEKGAAFMGAAVVSCLSWFYPLASKLKPGSGDLGQIISQLSGFDSLLFHVGIIVWIGSYIVSMVDAGRTSSKLNQSHRRALGLEN